MFDIASVSDVLARAGDPSRSIAAALALIGVSGLTIAMAGLYGVMAYLVGLRRAEFGIRKVLGATNGEIYALVLGDASRMVGLGLLIGLPLAYVVALGAGRGLIGVAAFAAWWPARRAARVEPATTLREM
jgi:ABC-type antimicrobial peptide transport system permease subunit